MNDDSFDYRDNWPQFRLSTLMLSAMVGSLAIAFVYASREIVRLRQQWALERADHRQRQVQLDQQRILQLAEQRAMHALTLRLATDQGQQERWARLSQERHPNQEQPIEGVPGLGSRPTILGPDRASLPEEVRRLKKDLELVEKLRVADRQDALDAIAEARELREEIKRLGSDDHGR